MMKTSLQRQLSEKVKFTKRSFFKGIRLRKLCEKSDFLETRLGVTAARDKMIGKII